MPNSYFWRTYDQKEIDYLEEYEGRVYAYEFKWEKNKSYRLPKEFLQKYNSEFKLISSDNYHDFLLNNTNL